MRKRHGTSFSRLFKQNPVCSSLETGNLASGLAVSQASTGSSSCFVIAFRKWAGSRTLWSLNQMHSVSDSGTHNGPLSSALARTGRGKLCDVILRDRSVATFEKDQVICVRGGKPNAFLPPERVCEGRKHHGGWPRTNLRCPPSLPQLADEPNTSGPHQLHSGNHYFSGHTKVQDRKEIRNENVFISDQCTDDRFARSTTTVPLLGLSRLPQCRRG